MNNSSHINDDSPRLTPREEKFSCPEKLKRSEVEGLDTSLWDELCIAASENELENPALLDNEEFRQEVSRYSSLKLKADNRLTYPDKSSLKKSSPKVGLWICVAAAAIALLIAIPAIMRNSSSEPLTPQLVTTPSTPEKSPQGAQSSKPDEKHEADNTPAITQAKNTTVEPKSVVKNTTATAGTKDNEIKSVTPTQELKRLSLGLNTIEPIQQIAVMAANTEGGIKQHSPQADTQNIILFASSDEVERMEIEVEKPSFLDRLREKSIVNVNRLLGKGTIVVREYDSDGKLTLYAVQSGAINFEKDFTE